MSSYLAKRLDVRAMIAERDDFVRRADAVLDEIEAITLASRKGADAWRRLAHLASAELHYNGFDRKALPSTPAQVIDGTMWFEYLERTGLLDHLPKRYRDKFVRWRYEKGEDVRPFTAENVERLMVELYDERWDWLAERIRDVFSLQSVIHKSTDANRISDKIVLTAGYGGYCDMVKRIRDIESVVYHIMGETLPAEGDRLRHEDTCIHGVPHKPVLENAYLKLRPFKNGNVHITWTKAGKDAQGRLNDVLALGASRTLGGKR